MSQVYIANMSRGDQSSRPFRQASRTAEMNEPVRWAILFEAGQHVSFQDILVQPMIREVYYKYRTLFLFDAFPIKSDRFNEICHSFNRLCAQRTLEGRQLEARLDMIVERERDGVLLLDLLV